MFTRVPLTETIPFTQNFQIDFFIMQIGKIADVFPKKTLNNVPCAIELISSNWKVIPTCADSYITDIFFTCKCVINELTGIWYNCQSSHMHQYTRQQEVNKKSMTCLYITVKNAGIYTCSKQCLSETISGTFYGPLSMSAVILIAEDTLTNTAETKKKN